MKELLSTLRDHGYKIIANGDNLFEKFRKMAIRSRRLLS